MEPDLLTDGTLIVRRVSPGDAASIAEAVGESLPELARWMPWAHPGYSVRDASEWLARAETDGSRQYVILESGATVGVIGLMPRPEDVVELGYWVRTGAAGRGLCTRAATLLVQHAFALGKGAVVVKADVANVASQRVARKIGGLELADRDRHTHDDGSGHDLVVFLVKPDQLSA